MQGQTTHEGFVKETSFLYVKAKPFRLAERPLLFISFPVTKNQLKEALKSHLPDSTLQTIIENVAMDSVSNLWAGSLLNDVQLINKAEIDTLLGTVIIVRDGENKSAYRKKVKLLESKRGIMYFLSHPIFDASGKFALMRVRMACGSGCGEHYFILFLKKDDKWIKITEVYHLMS
jgi:hypothetical protein